MINISILANRISSNNTHNSIINNMRYMNGSVKRHSLNIVTTKFKKKYKYIKPEIKLIEGVKSEYIEWNIKNVKYFIKPWNDDVTLNVLTSEGRGRIHTIGQMIYVPGFGNLKVYEIKKYNNEITVSLRYK